MLVEDKEDRRKMRDILDSSVGIKEKQQVRKKKKNESGEGERREAAIFMRDRCQQRWRLNSAGAGVT